jgi:hypothetical protein
MKMAEENRREDQSGSQSGTAASKQERTGDPGRTPGKAEGDERTVEEDLRDKGNKEQT